MKRPGSYVTDLVDGLNITGPAARACGAALDTRRDHPYGIYSNLNFEKRTAANGDVKGRFDVKAGEIIDSVNIIQSILDELAPEEVRVPYHDP